MGDFWSRDHVWWRLEQRRGGAHRLPVTLKERFAETMKSERIVANVRAALTLPALHEATYSVRRQTHDWALGPQVYDLL